MEFFLILLIIFSAFGAVFSGSPLQSVIYLMLLYLQFVYLFFSIGADFLAIALLIVYVGAISILMLFVVMMFNLKVIDLYINSFRYVPIVVYLFFIFLFEFFYIFLFGFGSSFQNFFFHGQWVEDFYDFICFYDFDSLFDLNKFGDFFYNYYFVLLIVLSILLLVSMIGSIVLTFYYDFVYYDYELCYNDFYYFGDFLKYNKI